MSDNTLHTESESMNPATHNNENNNQETQEKLQACYNDLEQWKDKFFRVSADYQNFKKRTEKEQISWIRNAQSDIIKNLLPVIDDIDRALVESRKKEQHADMKSWIDGLEMIYSSFYKFLKKVGVEEITQVAIFDPALHEAIASVQVPGKQAGDIVEVLQKGFTLHGELLRPAQVAVAQ